MAGPSRDEALQLFCNVSLDIASILIIPAGLNFLFLSISLSLCLSVSVTHTHTHTHFLVRMLDTHPVARVWLSTALKSSTRPHRTSLLYSGSRLGSTASMQSRSQLLFVLTSVLHFSIDVLL